MSLNKEILQQIENIISNLIIVSDPDGLLIKEEMLLEIEKKKYKLINYDDPLLLRYEYEMKYRIPLEEGILDSKVIIHLKDYSYSVLPFDMLMNGKTLSFSLSELFPSMDTGVIRELSLEQLEKLYKVKSDKDHMGERATKKYVLRNIFKIDTDMIVTVDDLFQYLIDRHYCDEFYPSSIDEYLIEVFSAKFQDITVENLFKRESWLAFLQKEWEIFLLSYVDKDKKSTVPFNNKDIRVYMDNYFLEGLLRPVLIYKPAKIPVWTRPGLIRDQGEEDRERFEKLFEIIKEEIPYEKSSFKDWFKFADKWAECLKTYYEIKKPFDIEEEFEEVNLQIEEEFGKWMIVSYSSKIGLSPFPSPVMTHHVLPYISLELNRESKAALVILDGMSLDEWLIVKECITGNEMLEIKENRMFAMVPTITSVSRQSILSGLTPEFFSASINSTAKEETLWRNFWEKEGMMKKPFFLGNQKFTKSCDCEDYKNSSVMAVIVNTIDELNHGASMDRGQVYDSIKRWIDKGVFINFIDHLLHGGFTIYITSDHGNIYATGHKLLEGRNLSSSKGKRVHIFDKIERRDMALKNGRGIKWTGAGLPDDYFPLLAAGKEAFTTEGDKIICHGGISIEEVIVPFIEIRRKKNG